MTLEGDYTIGQGLTSTFQGTILNNGPVRFENATSASTLRIEGSVSLNGTNSLNLEGPLSRIDPSLDVATDKILNASQIRGRGMIAVKIDNLAGGTLASDLSGSTLTVSQTLTNTGALRASNNSTLTLSGGGSSTQPIQVSDTSVLNFSGGTFVLDGGANLTGPGAARITAGMLNIGNDTGDSVTVNKLALVGGDIGGVGQLNVATALDWTSGTIGGTGAVILPAGSVSNWTGSNSSLDGRTIFNAGLINWNKTVNFSGNAGLNNLATIDVQGDNQYTASGPSVFNNAGLVKKTAGAGTAIIGALFNNSGIARSQSGTLLLNNGGTQTGEFNAVAATDVIAFSGAHLIKAGAIFTGNGIARATGGTMTFGESAADQFALTNFHVNGAAVAGPGSLFISNSMNWNSGAIGGSGAVELLASSSSIWNPASGTAWSRRTLNNSGAITQQNYFFANNGAQLNNFGSYNVTGDHAIYGSAGAVFSNSGTLTKTSGAGTASFELPFYNSGLVESQSGTFNMNTGGTHTGVFKMSSGATVSFNGAHFIQSGAGFQGTGTVLIGSATTTFGETAADTYSLANLKVTGGDVAGPATLNIADSLNWSGAMILGTGVINLAAGSTSVWDGSSSTLNGRTLNNHGTTTLSRDLSLGAGAVLNNFGSFELQGAPTVFVGAGGGTFINTGTFTKTGTGTATFTTVFQNGNAGQVQVNAGALQLFGGGTHQGDFAVNGVATVLRMTSGENQLDGSTITGTGAVEVSGNLRVANGGAIIESRLALQSGSLVTGTGQLDVSSVTWTDGTMSDTGKTLVVPGGAMTISGGSTKNIEKRTLENQGTLTWSGDGIIRAQDGGRLVNFGTMTITGNGTFDGLPGSPNPGAFINAVGGTVTKSNATGVTVFESEFVNNGTANFSGFTAPAGFASGVAAAPSQSIQLKKGSSGSGNWFYDNVIVEWFLGLFGSGNQQLNNGSQATVQVASGQNFQVNASLTLGNASSMVASGGGNIVASGGGNIVAGGGGNIVAGGGGNIVAGGGGNIVAGGGGNIVASGGGNLIANDGGTLIANDGGTLIANDGGTIVAGGGGNVQVTGAASLARAAGISAIGIGANIVAGGGGNLQSTGLAGIVAGGGGNIVAGGGGNIVAGGGGNIVAGGGGNIVAGGGGNLVAGGGGNIAAAVGKSPAAGSLASVPPPGSFIAESGGNLIGHTGGVFTGGMYALSGGSLLPGGAGVAGIMSVNGNVTLDSGSKLKLDIRGLAQGTEYDLLDVNTFETMAGSVIFNGDLLLSMIYGVRTSASALTQFTILTTDAPITGTIGNLVAGRVTTTDGFGSFAVTTADAGSDLVLSDFTATPLTYALWKTAFAFAPGGELFTADNDHDGLSNGLEYGLGSDPLVPDADAAPRVSLTEAVVGSGVRYLTLTYERPVGVNRPTDLAWSVQRSTDLANPAGWSSAGLAAEQVTPHPGTGLEKVVVRSQTALDTAGLGKEFLRLSVEKL